MGFKKCFIADLFCGAGKNGTEKGSPLVLLDTLQYLFTKDSIREKTPKVFILFNDSNEKNIQNLRKELEGFLDDFINILPSQNKKFEDILPNLLKEIKKHSISGVPKFFFLDPFTYSNVKMEDLRAILDLEYTEILLFVPVFHSYRFASNEKMRKDHKTREFIEAFTTKGIHDYKENDEGIDDFMKSMKEKLTEDLSLDFVRPVLLDDGKCKNALFLLTKRIEGMLAMNHVALGESDDGKGVNIKIRSIGQSSLFGTHGTSKFEIFTQKFIEELRKNKEMTNEQIVNFTIVEEFLPRHANDILKKLYEDGMMEVYDQFGRKIENKRQWNIAEKITKVSIFRFVD